LPYRWGQFHTAYYGGSAAYDRTGVGRLEFH